MQYQDLFEKSPAPMFVWDFETKQILDCNLAALQLYGYTKTEFTQLSIYDIRPDNEVEKIKQATKDLKSYINTTSNSHKNYWIHKKKSGEIIYVEVFAHIINYNNRDASYVIIVDVTQKFLAEAAQKKSEEQFKILFQLSPLPRFNININTLHFVNANKSAIDVYGFTEQEFLAMKVTDIFCEYDKNHFLNEIEKTKNTNGIIQLGSFDHQTKSNKFLKIKISGSRFFLDGVEYLLIVCLDITENESLIKTLESRNNFIETILKNIPIGIAVNEIDTSKATIVNDNFSKIYGWPSEEISDVDNFFNAVYPDVEYRNQIKQRIIDDINSNDINRLEWKNIRITTKNGETRYVNAKNIPLFHQNLMISTVIDVTNEYEQALQIEQVKNNQEALINGTDDLIWSIDQNLNIITANQAYFNTMKLVTQRQIKAGDSVFVEEFGPEMNVKWKAYYERAITGEKFEVEDKLYNPFTKKNSYNLTSFNPIINANNEIIGVACFAKNITEIKEAQEAMEYSNKRFEYVTKATFDAIWDWDIVENKIFWGENYSKLFGYLDDAAITDTQKVHNRLHPNELQDIIKSVDEVFKTNSNNWQREHLFKKSNGEYTFVSNKAIIVRDNTGKPIRAIGAMQDISVRKQEEQRLKLMESVIVNANDAVIITEAEPIDLPGPKIIYVNEAFTKITGYSQDEVVGKSPRILQGPKTDKNELYKLRKALENWQPAEITIINYKKNGDEFWINFSLKPIANKDGWYTHWISIERDVTENKKNEIQKQVFNEISLLFNKEVELITTLQSVTELITNFDNYNVGEIWLVDNENAFIELKTTYANTKEIQNFYTENKIKQCQLNEDLAGIVWKTKQVQLFTNIHDNKNFLRKELAKKYQLQTFIGIPLSYNNQFLGVVILGSQLDKNPFSLYRNILSDLETFLGAEIKRKKLEEELNRIFLTAPDVIATINKKGFFKKINPACCKLLEYTEDELLSIPLSELMHPDDRNKSIDELNNIAETQSSMYFENRYITKNGNTIWLAWTVTASTEEDLFFGVAKNITEQKRLSQLLNEANTLAKIGSWEVNLINNTIYWSSITKEIHEVDDDYVPDLVTSINFYKEGEDREKINSLIQESLSEGKEWDVELKIITAKKNEKWVRAIGKTEFRNGICVRVFGSFQDIDYRKKAEEIIKTSNERFTNVVRATNDAIWDWDITNDTLYWGEGFKNIFGLEHGIVAPSEETWTKYIHPDDLESTVNNFNETIANTSKNNWIYEYRFKNNDGKYTHVIDKALILRNHVGEAIRVVGAMIDITYRIEHEESLKFLNKQLDERAKQLAISNTELEQFAYIASHDLQEPLRMVSSFLTQLEKKYNDLLDEKGKKYIYLAVDGSKRMRQIILDLLEFSRVGRFESTIENVNMNLIVQDVLKLLKKSIDEKNVNIIVDPLPILKTYTSPITQVFQNLINNAIKYSKPNTRTNVRISFTENGHEYIFSVSDNGIGIESTYFEKIFIIFQRLHLREEYSGTGMGLAIVKKIVENLNGRIWVESEIDIGSTFYFTLPKIQ
jgi:PAS domain S-box-containing protein